MQKFFLLAGLALVGLGSCLLPSFEKVDSIPDASTGGAGSGGVSGSDGNGGGPGGDGGTAGSGGAAGSGGSIAAECDSAIELADGAEPESCPPGGGQSENCGGLGESCCVTLCVPGGTYTSEPVKEGGASKTAVVSTFFLDKYEVSVGRYLQFMKAGAPKPAVGAGADAVFVGGWRAAWGDAFSNPANGDFNDDVYCTTYDPQDAGIDQLDRPVTCVHWYWALAFCIWDGGRLPTEAEWMLAASGGDDRRFAWGDTVNNVNPETAFDCSTTGDPSSCTGWPMPWKFDQYQPQFAGKFGHVGLTGNVAEFALDLVGVTNPINGGGAATEPLPDTCNDCWVTSGTLPGSPDVPSGVAARGGGWQTKENMLGVATRGAFEPLVAPIDGGFRCARPAK
jgi:formylglycine-generating enzyme required for sulfatase activity